MLSLCSIKYGGVKQRMLQLFINVFNIKENIRKAQKLNQSLNTLVQSAFSGTLIKQKPKTSSYDSTTITVQLGIAFSK